MNFSNLGEIKAVAFDIDGTLYDERPFNRFAFPFAVSHLRVFLSYWKTRKVMHSTDEYDDFYKYQAEIMGKYLGCSPEEGEKAIKEYLHIGIGKIFPKLKAVEGSLELIKKLKANGLKIGLLSDLPTEYKGDIWGIKPYCDVVICSEESGAVKPSKKPFLMLAEKLGVKPEEIFYVGNNYKNDILGSRNAGMKNAWFAYHPIDTFKRKKSIADITFLKYSELDKFLFN